MEATGLIPANTQSPVLWRMPLRLWALVAVTGAVLAFSYAEAIARMLQIWETKEEYSYGYLVPPLIVLFIWQKKDLLERLIFKGSWAGLWFLVPALLLYLIGNLSTVIILVQYSMVLMIAGLVLAFTGWPGFRAIVVPLALLFFMIPMPEFLFKEISAYLQLVSSEFGVAVIRLFGISVFLEGNVIDLGSMRLQVVEACSGLRYLFPLMTLGFVAAYFFKAPMWKRVTVFFSTIPVTVLMNSFRIGMIGVLVEFRGKSHAEGFLHDFEGWVVFMACTAVLVGEMWLLNRIGGPRRPWREVFGIELPAKSTQSEFQRRSLPAPFVAAIGLLGLSAALSILLPQRSEAHPARPSFATFPHQMGEWRGRGDRIDQIVLDTLRLDDYLLMNYADPGNKLVNLYVAYYGSQRSGQSAHSPRTCIPGGGWKIASLEPHTVTGAGRDGRLAVNRTLIEHGENRQLVYYWFDQRGRNLTNEYLVKWYILWDALTRNRTDGAMVRLITPLAPGEDTKDADVRLAAFARIAQPTLSRYVPE